jgi:penicillin amidase
MKILKFSVAFLLTVGLTYFLANPQTVGGKKIPALGNFLNPFTGCWQNAESKSFVPSGKFNFDELKAEATVVYDDRLVPHIFAQNDEDAAFMQGYVTAQNRLWQMEFQTHAIAGRLTEIVGEIALSTDKETRRMGLPFAAKKTLEAWKKQPSFAIVEAYTAGVNAYIQSLKKEDYPLEYKLLNYKPEEWTPIKCVLFTKAMANTLARQDNDIETTNILNVLGRELFDFLYPEWFPQQSTIIPEGTKWNFTPIAVSDTIIPSGQTSLNALPKVDPFLGSNNWAVSGKKTASGKPILCGDPHLKMTLPAIWFEIQINTPNYNVYGASLPAIPGVIIGFNNHIAWSQTNVGRDVLDWYAIRWKNADKKAYLWGNQYKKANIVIEEFKIKGSETVYDTVRYTHHGPIVFDDKKDPKGNMALRWLAHDAPLGDEVGVFQKLAKAKNYAQYAAAIKDFACPAQNFVFASVQGDVALWCQGTYPLKSKEQGRFVMDGSRPENDWKGFIPQTHNPHVINPERGFVSSANQHSTTPDYPYYYAGSFDDYRGRYINAKLAAMDSVKVQEMMSLQTDNFSLLAAEMLPLLTAKVITQNLSSDGKKIMEKLKKWKFRYEKDLVEPTFFDEWLAKFNELLWDEMLQHKEKMPIRTPELWRTTVFLRNNPTSSLFDIKKTKKQETFEDIATLSFNETLKQFKKGIPKWEQHKSTTIGHLARLDALSARNVSVGGSKYAPNAISKENGPSWRMIVALEKTPKAYIVYPGGQSGNVGSRFYDSFIPHWQEGKYYEAFFMQSKTEKNKAILATQYFSN